MKRTILLLGAGKSSSSLIDYFSRRAAQENWQLTVADISLEAAAEKAKGHAVQALQLDIHDTRQLHEAIAGASLVISLLPASLHGNVARECVQQGIHLATASYVSGEMAELHDEAVRRGVTLLNECGLDPGLDHMSAMELVDRLRNEGAEITSFKSYTGGLVAPESNDNPWGYKFSWNPRNVILAGQGTARYIENGDYKYIPYSRLFEHAEKISVRYAGSGSPDDRLHFDAYANRDSLAYRKIYGLNQVPTLLRGTLRQEHFCKAWNVFVQLGLTDDSYPIEDSEHLTYAALVQSFLPAGPGHKTIDEKLADFMHMDVDDDRMKMIRWTGILSGERIGMVQATPAQILQKLLEAKWKLKPADKDMIVMQHLLKYRKEQGGNEFEITASLLVKGEDAIHTAMAKTVGLPLAIASGMLLNNRLEKRGVVLPVDKEIYQPVLEELKTNGIRFEEEHRAVSLSL